MQTRLLKSLPALLVAAVCCFAAGTARAAPPQTLNYQGYLTNPTGTPVNTSVAMTFRRYNVASGGAALYLETQPSVSVSNGGFNAVIGTVTPIALPFDVPYWLTVAVNSDAEMSPRQPLASSAYAFRAASVDAAATIGGAQISGSITNATLPATQITGTINAATAASAAALTGNVSGGQITGAINAASAATVTGSVAGSQISGVITTATIGGALVSGPVASATTATTATTAASFSGPLGGDITGQQGSTTISAIRGSAVSAAVPADGQVLIFRGGQWQPAADVANLIASVANLNSPRAYVANTNSSTVTVIDTASNTVVGAPITVGLNPFGIALNPSGSRAYVANFNSNNVTLIDTATNTVVGAPITVGLNPGGIALNPSGSRAYVASQSSNNVTVIDTATNAPVVGSPIMVGTNPLSIAVNPSGSRAYVANLGSNNVTVIDTATNTVVGAIAVGSAPFAIAVNPSGSRAYVANRDSNNVMVIDTATNAVVGAPIAVGFVPIGIAVK